MVEQRAAELIREMGTHLTERAEWWRDRIDEVAGGRDDVRLRLIREHIALLDAHIDQLRSERDCAAQRLRDQGVPMTKIATLAGVSDSYLARRVFDQGSKRKFIRKGGLLAAGGILTLGAACTVFMDGSDLDPALYRDQPANGSVHDTSDQTPADGARRVGYGDPRPATVPPSQSSPSAMPASPTPTIPAGRTMFGRLRHGSPFPLEPPTARKEIPWRPPAEPAGTPKAPAVDSIRKAVETPIGRARRLAQQSRATP